MTTSAIYALIHKLEKDGGVWWARGGTNRLVAAMVRHFERLGGTVRLGDPVVQIHTIGTRVTEVETASGWQQRFDAVASNADIMHTYRDLLGDTLRGQKQAKALARKRFSPSLFVVHFGIEGTWPGIPHHIDPVRPALQGAAQGHLRSRRAAGRFLDLSPPPHRDRSLDGAGGQEHVLRAGAGGPYGQAADRLGTGRPDAGKAHP